MKSGPERKGGQRRYGAWIAAGLLGAASLVPAILEYRQAGRASERLDALDAALLRPGAARVPLDPGTLLRVARLGPLLSSWETVGGCGAGSTGGTGVVKWIGRSTTGGLFQSLSQFNYTHFTDGYNLVATEQITRDIGEHWSVGVFVPFVYKYYFNYLANPGEPAVDVSNSGFGDINLLGTFKFDPINATSLTASLGLPTGTHDARFRGDLLTQEKQLGIGLVTGSLMLDHTFDEIWGLIVVGGIAAWRGGRNELGSYRAPMASLYGYGGYFMGPFVPALGLTFSGFLKPDENQREPQDVPLLLLAPNASIEWSNDVIAVLLGFSLPFGLYAKKPTVDTIPGLQPSPTGLQPWTAAIGVSVSPF